MKMNLRQVVGLISFAFGTGLIIYAVHSMQKISAAKEDVHGAASWFSGSPFGQFLGGVMEKKASQYDQTVIWLLIAGAALLIIGGGVIFLSRTRKE